MSTPVNNPTNAAPKPNQAIPFIRSASGQATAKSKHPVDAFNSGKDYIDEGAPLLTAESEKKSFKPYGVMTHPLVQAPTRDEMDALSHPDEKSQTQLIYLKEAMVMDVDAKLIISSMDQMKRGIFREAHYPTLIDYMKSPYYRKLRESRIVAESLAGIGRKTRLRESDDKATIAGVRLNPRLVSLYQATDKKIYKKLKESGFEKEMKRFREDAFSQEGVSLGSTQTNFDGGRSFDVGGREPDFIPLMAGPYNKQLYFFDYLDMHAKSYEAWTHSPVAKRIVKVITQFVLGKGVKMTVMKAVRRSEEEAQAKQNALTGKNLVSQAQRISSRQGAPAAQPTDWKMRCQEVLDRHWSKNKLHIRSKKILRSLVIFGEQFPRYFDAPWGLKLRQIDPSTVWEVVTDPDDCENEFYLHQQYPTRFQWMVDLPVPCLVGETRVRLLNGKSTTLKKLAKQFSKGKIKEKWLYAFDIKKRMIVPGKAKEVWKSGVKGCYKITLDNGKSIEASYDHPFLMRDGTYSEAGLLKPGDSLMPFNRRMSKGKHRFELSGYEQIFQPSLNRWEYTHRRVCKESKLKCPFGFVRHHKDFNPRNNEPNNFEIVTHAKHTRIHCHTKQSQKKAALARSKSKKFAEANRERSIERWARPGEKIAAHYDLVERWTNPEYAKHMSDVGKKDHKTRKERGVYDKISKTKKGKPPSRETRLAQKTSVKKIWADPISRAKMMLALASSRPEAKYKLRFPRVENHKVTKVEWIGNREVYDVQMEGNHNFGLDAGCFVHNTIKFIIRQVPAAHYYHMLINTTEGEVRGRSELFAILGWLKRLKEYASDRVIRNKMANLFILDLAVEGGPAEVQALQNQFQVPPTTGSFFIHNKAAELNSVKAEVGASDTQGDWEMLLTIIAMGAGLSQQYLGMSPGGGKAEALVGTEPDIKTFEDYQELMEDFLVEDARRVYERAKEKGEIPSDVSVTVEATFPALAEENRSEKLKDFAFGESMSWWSHRRTASAAAKEMQMTSYDYDDEQKEIATEDATREYLINTAYQQVTKGVDSAAQSGSGSGGTSSGSSGKGASGMGPGKSLPSSTPSKQSATGESVREAEGDEDTAPGTSTATKVSSFAVTHNASAGRKTLPRDWRGSDVDNMGRKDNYRNQDPRDVAESIKREAANLRYDRRSVGRRQDRVQTPDKVRDQKSLDRTDVVTKARKALKSGNFNKESKKIQRFPRYE